MTARLQFLTRIFLLRFLVSPPNLHLGEFAHSFLASPDPSWRWWPPLRNLQLTLGSPLNNILRFSWPPLPNSLHFDIILKGLCYQDRSLPSGAIIPAWLCWYSSLSGCSLIGMDASKDNSKTAIAAVLYHILMLLLA